VARPDALELFFPPSLSVGKLMVHIAAVSTAGPTLAGCTGWSEVIFPQVQQVLRVIVVEAVMEDLAGLKVEAG